uniref:NAD(P)(+)--arginine ADP-ribosyltransferase n=1 Tax=Hucho hucho TaxID=62062 RepID=A0A4W5MDY5_9TELE
MSLFYTMKCCFYSSSRSHWTWPQILLMTNMKVAQRKMYTKAANYPQDEKQTNSKFDEAWKTAEQKAKPPKHRLNREHSIVMYLYTNNKPRTKPKSQSLYFDFNKAVRNGKSQHGKTLQYHSLHFYLTDAIRILKLNQTTCRTTYCRTGTSFNQSVVDKEIHFGSFKFKLATQNLTFGNASCFEFNTEVLIPPHEVFKVTEVQKNQWCEVVYKVESPRSQSNLNCRLLNGPKNKRLYPDFIYSNSY